jgi:hypothetical protein
MELKSLYVSLFISFFPVTGCFSASNVELCHAFSLNEVYFMFFSFIVFQFSQRPFSTAE